jgi:tetratricopeptide (TPR) repeat protein
MKKLVYIFLLATQIFWAQSGFEKGNAAYRKGNYPEAITSYESVLKTRKHSAELYYNLGNAYYKMNKVAPAIYNYEKALLLDPGDREIKNNLNFARKMAIDDIKETPRVGFNKMIQDVTSAFDYDSWAWISVGFAIIFLLLFVGYYFSNTTLSKRLFFFGMFVSVIMIAIGIVSAVFEKSYYREEKPAIVFAEVLPVKSEPKSDSPDAFVLHEGTKVYVLESLDEWRKIQLPDETEGWIEANGIKEVK